MKKDSVLHGTVHKTPTDMRDALLSRKTALTAWETLTPLARNEWICWTTYVKNEDTRKAHIKRMIVDLAHGKRRPCCWLGCIHRKDKAISPSVAAILKKKKS